MINIFFTSDHHFGHSKIIEYCDRPFKTVKNMDEYLIYCWNSVVGKNDTVYHLGDFSFAKVSKIEEYVAALNGRIYLVRGNHDIKNIHLAKGFEHVYGKNQNIELKIGSNIFYLSHYPHLSWPKSHYGTYHLHGHCHGSLNIYAKNSLDVGVDCNYFCPISLEEVVKKIEARK